LTFVVVVVVVVVVINKVAPFLWPSLQHRPKQVEMHRKSADNRYWPIVVFALCALHVTEMAREGPSHSHRGTVHKIPWRLVEGFQRYARRQTDKHTDRQTDRNTPLPYRDRVIIVH